MARKLSFALITSMLKHDALQPYMGVWMLLLFLSAHIAARPYRVRGKQLLETVVLSVIILNTALIVLLALLRLQRISSRAFVERTTPTPPKAPAPAARTAIHGRHLHRAARRLCPLSAPRDYASSRPLAPGRDRAAARAAEPWPESTL